VSPYDEPVEDQPSFEGNALLTLAEKGCADLTRIQQEALNAGG